MFLNSFLSTHFKANLLNLNLHTGAEVRLSLKITSIDTEFFISEKKKTTIVQICVTNTVQGMLFQLFSIKYS